ncbi:MauE/DoxX family redox-associated membrane protein [Actinoplanes sp. NPDC051859]|uniref:MauE/DoxX family redox-associated membrane protein n=1 Tax=Actinoplanes sp. NPDC051859 TaxID=3363909 RepID=UPI00378A60A6
MIGHVATACLVAVGLTFSVAAWNKARGRVQRQAALSLVQAATGLTGVRAGIAVTALVAVETAVPVALAVPPWRPVGGWLAVALSVGLLGGVLLLADRDVPCACFGEPTAMVSGLHAVRNAGLVALAIGGAVAPPLPLTVPTAVAGILLCLCIVRFEALGAAVRAIRVTP